MKVAWIDIISISLFSFSAAEGQFKPGGGRPPAGGSPQEAFEACEQKQQDSACSFQAPQGDVGGSCQNMREGMVCVPQGPRGVTAPAGRQAHNQRRNLSGCGRGL
ncbi:MAG: hypothetical protein PVI97_16295 [Candidatus Thiodiazotropha sp.]|jgi:hypothetical protein